MSGRIVSLDIIKGGESTIDVARMLPLSETSAMRNHSGDFIDDMLMIRGDADIFVTPVIRISRFYHVQGLDIAHPTAFTRRLGKRMRKRYLNLVKPLYIPHGALDVRAMEKVESPKKHVDLYTRSLSRSLMMRRRVKSAKKFLRRNRRGIVGTLAMMLLLTAPVLWYVKLSLEDGYAKLASLTRVTDVVEAKKVTSSARVSFERAHFLFLPFSWIPLEPVDLVRRASLGGLSIARATDDILSIVPTDTGALIEAGDAKTLSPTYRAVAEDIFPLARFGIDVPTDWIRAHRESLVTAVSQLQTAADLYANTTADYDIALKMQRAGKGLSKVASYLSWYFDHEENVLRMLGDDNPARYVVFNQNRDEIRANGGFPGTVISFTLYKGNILDYRKDDVYYYDWNLYPYKEQPPPGLTLMTDTYGLRDVNYYPDFRDTVEKANNFIERSGDSTITTGIAIHQGLIEDILREIGPISVSGVTIPFDNKNFSALMSTLVEAQYGRELHAKDILFDFVSAFVKKVNETKKYDAIFNVLEKYWNDGEILIASRDESVDTFLSEYRKKLPWECDNSAEYIVHSTGSEQTGGSMTSSLVPSIEHQVPNICTRNWVYPIFTSVGGNKSDRYIKRQYTATTKKIQNCTYENKVTITNTHTFSAFDKQTIASYLKEFQITDAETKNKINFVEGNSPNKAFVRVYVPTGSALIGSGGSIQTTMGDEATVFSFLLDTPVGGSASKTLHYTTEIPHCIDYTGGVNWYKQPGLREVEMK